MKTPQVLIEAREWKKCLPQIVVCFSSTSGGAFKKERNKHLNSSHIAYINN